MMSQPLAPFTFPIKSESETETLAATLALILQTGDVVALKGDLGAGKTAFTRALINALPGEVEDVPSPTFTLVQTYTRGALEVWHFDLYRMEDPGEAFELGIEDAFVEAISLIEWPERLGRLLPTTALQVHISADSKTEHRTFTFTGNQTWIDRLMLASWPAS